MKNIEKGSITYLILQIIAIIIASMIVWPLLDFIICKYFTHSTFTYSITEHIIKPIIFSTIVGIVFWIFDKKKIKNKDNK